MGSETTQRGQGSFHPHPLLFICRLPLPQVPGGCLWLSETQSYLVSRAEGAFTASALPLTKAVQRRTFRQSGAFFLCPSIPEPFALLSFNAPNSSWTVL